MTSDTPKLIIALILAAYCAWHISKKHWGWGVFFGFCALANLAYAVVLFVKG